MLTFFICVATSLLMSLLIIRCAPLHQHLSGDHDLAGVQKFHTAPVPRIGGFSIAVTVYLVAFIYPYGPDRTLVYSVMACTLPAFISGIYEDLSKRAGILLRLLSIFLSSGLIWYFAGARLTQFGIPYLDTALAVPVVSFIFTITAIAATTNAVNLIDGYNGLASATASIIFGGIAYIAFLQGDLEIFFMAVACGGAAIGFLFWNWPRGLIFLGDGGAYFLGFTLSSLSILLVARNPAVSPWCIVMLLSYPVVEIAFTVLRRTTRGKNPGLPDAAHLHQLVYKRLMRRAVGSPLVNDRLTRNSMTSPYLWVLSSLGVVPAMLAWDNTVVLQVTAGLFAAIYVWLYRRLAFFKSPKWLVYKKLAKPTKKTIAKAAKPH